MTLGLSIGAVLAGLSEVGRAQAPGQDELYLLFGSPPELLLLNQENVRKELRLTDKQTEAARLAYEKFLARIEGLVAMKREDRFAKIPELLEEGESATADILNPDQAKRLKQIIWQVRGVQAFVIGGQGKKAGITEEQQRKYWAIRKEFRKQVAELGQGAGYEKELAALKRGVEERTLNLLTEEQKAAWQKVTGEPFKGDLHLGPFGGFQSR